jgi:hypothetical protein
MKILDFVMCDDIRQEVGNKRTLVGVYDAIQINDVAPDKLDKAMGPYRIAFYFRIDPEGESFEVVKYGIEIVSQGQKTREVLIDLADEAYRLVHLIPLALIVFDFMVPPGDKIEFNVIIQDANAKRITLAVPHYLMVNRVARNSEQ